MLYYYNNYYKEYMSKLQKQYKLLLLTDSTLFPYSKVLDVVVMSGDSGDSGVVLNF